MDPKLQWAFGADGIEFDSKGNRYVGSFGDGKLYRITFDESGKVTGNKLFTEAPGRRNTGDPVGGRYSGGWEARQLGSNSESSTTVLAEIV